MISSDLVLALSGKATFRSFGDSAVILVLDSGQIYSCSSTAEAFLRRIDGIRAIEAVACEIGDEFDVEPDTLIADMDELISYLLSEAVVLEV